VLLGRRNQSRSDVSLRAAQQAAISAGLHIGSSSDLCHCCTFPPVLHVAAVILQFLARPDQYVADHALRLPARPIATPASHLDYAHSPTRRQKLHVLTRRSKPIIHRSYSQVSAQSGRPSIAMATFGRETLQLQVYHHAVLPRHVPGREDRNLYRVESELLRRLIDAVKLLVPHTPLDDLAGIDAIRLALSTCSALNIEGKIDRAMLIKEMRQLEAKRVLILHVTEQNAALLVYPHVR
jgi:hypothetical protein